MMVVSTDPQREQVLKLIEEKDKIEKKISDLGLVLQQVGILSESTMFVSLTLLFLLFRTKSASMSHSSMLKASRERRLMFVQSDWHALKSFACKTI